MAYQIVVLEQKLFFSEVLVFLLIYFVHRLLQMSRLTLNKNVKNDKTIRLVQMEPPTFQNNSTISYQKITTKVQRTMDL